MWLIYGMCCIKYGIIREIRRVGRVFVIRIVEVGKYVFVKIFWVVVVIKVNVVLIKFFSLKNVVILFSFVCLGWWFVVSLLLFFLFNSFILWFFILIFCYIMKLMLLLYWSNFWLNRKKFFFWYLFKLLFFWKFCNLLLIRLMFVKRYKFNENWNFYVI